MQLHEKTRARIETTMVSAGCTTVDVRMAINIVEAFSDKVFRTAELAGTRPSLRHDIDATTYDDRFLVVFRGGFELFSLTDARLIASQSPTRIIDVRVDLASHTVSVVVARDSTAGRALDLAVFAGAATAKRRYVATDFDAARVKSLDDQHTIDQLVADVYHVEERVSSDMLFFFETIRDESGGARTRTGTHIPLSERVAADASESTDASEAATGAIAGYSLCFTNTPPLSLAFLAHLNRKYPSIIESMFAWFPTAAAAAEPMFVVNIRSVDAPLSSSRRAVAASTPRTTVKRRRGGSGSSASSTVEFT